MKKHKRSRVKHLTDAEIDMFCKSVEDILVKIKDKSSSKKGRRGRAKDILIADEDVFVDDELLPVEDELLTFH
ncbi:MAG: hypothetical protein HY809_06405 [Nitrospirae bacterium]|nr:hypothetical protein [Nitrospirota bacterium]